MQVLIVHAHPEPQSFTTAMKDMAVETFRAGGHTVTVSDLYAMRFNPVAGPDDFTARRDAEAGVFRDGEGRFPLFHQCGPVEGEIGRASCRERV